MYKFVTSLELIRFLMKWDEKLDKRVVIKINGNCLCDISGMEINHKNNEDNPVLVIETENATAIEEHKLKSRKKSGRARVKG